MKLSLDKLIGYGGFSRVYVARVISSLSAATVTEAAVKKMHITKHAHNSVLRHEASAYILLAGHRSIPEVYAWGRSQYYDYLALELLGDDVLSAQVGLTQRNFAILACEMLDALEHVHSRGIVHCDVKPANILFSSAQSPGRHIKIKLIDFGIAVPFRDLRTSVHLPEGSESKGVHGTPHYASLPAHMHCSPGRRDDLESLAYTLLQLASGSLPWTHCFSVADIFKQKSAWRASNSGLPHFLTEFVAYTRALDFFADPDYAYCRALVPGLEDGAMFDPTDDGPRVAEWQVDTIVTDAEEQAAVSEPPDSGSSTYSIPDSDDGWVPTSSWAGPMSIRECYLFGDEQAIVRDQLEHIEEPPAMAEPWLLYFHSPEKMEDL